MNRKNETIDLDLYRKGTKYAISLMRSTYSNVYTYKDLVNDAYLDCKGDPKLFFLAIKNRYCKFIREKYISVRTDRITQKGEKVLKKYIEVNHTSKDNFEDGSIELQGGINNGFGIDEKDFLDNLSEFDRNLIHLRDRGYNFEEIEKILDVSNFTISRALKRIKEMHTNSPFNGSKLKIVKRVKRKDFEKDKDKYMEEFGKEVGDYEVNEFYEQLPSKKEPSEGLLIKEKDSD